MPDGTEMEEVMFFKKKEKKLPLLKKENILMNCSAMEKDDVIRKIGQILVDTGYVEQEYVQGMLEREKTFATNIGNGIALPHGVEEAKKNIKASGIAVMIFPDGTPWGDEMVKLVVGIAGTGEEHLEILANIATKFGDPKAVEELTVSDVNTVYQILKGEE